jgi:hypothetical protein
MGYPSFFIIGPARSGTTLLRLMLNNHPDICVPFETHFIPDMHKFINKKCDIKKDKGLNLFCDKLIEHPWFRESILPAFNGENDVRDKIIGLRDRTETNIFGILYETYMRSKGKKIIGDKTPSYSWKLDMLRHIFPNAKFIYIVRDGRAVFLSWLKPEVDSMKNKNEIILSELWNEWLNAMLEFENKNKNLILTIKYEDLVKDSKKTLETVCSFLGVTYSRDMLVFYKNVKNEMPSSHIGKAMHGKLYNPISRDFIDEWKLQLSKKQILIFEFINRRYLLKYKYALMYKKTDALSFGFVFYLLKAYMGYLRFAAIAKLRVHFKKRGKR